MTRKFATLSLILIIEPRVLTLDYEDDPRAFGMPDDGGPSHADDVSLQQRAMGKVLTNLLNWKYKSKMVMLSSLILLCSQLNP